MRPAYWIAVDLSREAFLRPGLLALASTMIVLIPLQVGLSVGGLSRLAGPGGEGIRGFLTAGAFCPAMSAVFLFSGIVLPRVAAREMEPLLASPVSDRGMVLGIVLPFLVQSIIGSIPASLLVLAGFSLSADEPLPSGMRHWLELVLAMQGANLWIGCALIRSVSWLTGTSAVAWNILAACLGLALVDAAIGLRSDPGSDSSMLLRAAVLLSAVPVSWWFSRHMDREAPIVSP